MANPLILVRNALYGVPGMQAVNVTSAVQTLFDQQYVAGPASGSFTLGPLSPQLFQIPDPSFSNVKTFTISYSFPLTGDDRCFARGGKDGDTLTLAADTSQILRIVRAFYGAGNFGLDLTLAMADYFADPGNPRSLVIGNADFQRLFCGGNDPAPGVQKFFFLSLRPSPTGRIVSYNGFDGQTVDVSLDPTPPNRNWMTDLLSAKPSAANLKLRQFCLPASHDSGTFNLSSVFSPDPAWWLKKIMDFVKRVNGWIEAIPFIGRFINPLSWAYRDITGTVRALGTATRADILQQLDDGIRCLDLRVYYDDQNESDPFTLYHGLLGGPLSAALASIAFFVENLAPEGEIVYVTMGHYLRRSGQDSFTDDQLEQLAALVWDQLDSRLVFGPGDAPPGTLSLFDCTYAQIIGAGGTQASKVILVAKALPAASGGAQKTWPASSYSPADIGGSSLLHGGYTDTDSASAMFSAQSASSVTAKAGGDPFPLYLTLTPQPTTAVLLVAASLRNAVLVLATLMAAVPYIGWSLAAAARAVAFWIAAFIAERVVSYSSLEGLADKIFDSSTPTVGAIVASKFTGAADAVPSFIYMDFYENYTQPNPAGQNCSQLVETAKSICLSNANTVATAR